MKNRWPITRDLVLIGGGHTHALVLRAWGMDPLPGARLTLVNPGPVAAYTGMLPGFVAGHYDRDTLGIDLMRLARFAGARIVLGHAMAIDRERREILVEDSIIGARHIGYDVASIDIGVHSDLPELPGFAEHGVPAKPLDRFAECWAAHLTDADHRAPKAVIGGGVGGVELGMAMSFGSGGAPVTVIDKGRALSGLRTGIRAALLAKMADHRVDLIEHADVASISEDHVALADGRLIAARFVTGAAGARPYDWLAATGLVLEKGFVRIGPTLQTSDDRIFAAGDCAHMAYAPRPKAGVFAVRKAPVLNHNLRAALGAGRMRNYRPQRAYLKLVSTGSKSAVAGRSGLHLSGPLVWRWKDIIDRRFMARLATFPTMKGASPARHAAGLDTMTAQVHCGGCAAKAGQATLAERLPRGAAHRQDVEASIGGDAAILRMGDYRQAITVDQLRALTDDPGLMAHIAAHHALNDCLATGAAPQAALPVLTLARGLPEIEGRSLGEIMAAAGTVFMRAGAEIVGGHTATGSEPAIGFAVTGLIGGDARPGAAPKDCLILTKPLGTGVVMAAAMAGAAPGPVEAAALRIMAQGQIDAARHLARARAMTDITGFGLAGHLLGLLDAAGYGAVLFRSALPLIDGAAALLDAGHRSTLHDANRQMACRIDRVTSVRDEILFDPQTSGGLLAAIPPETARETLRDLQGCGYGAAIIGRIDEGAPRIILS